MIRRRILGVSSLIVLGLACFLITPRRSEAQNPIAGSAPVNIVGPLPLPVTGSVNIGAGSSVTVANPQTSPVLVRDVDETAKEPVQAGSVPTQFDNGGTRISLLTVPSNKRLVVEHFSANINATPATGMAGVSLNKGVLSNVADYAACQNTGNNNLNHFFTCAQQTKFYAGPGETVSFTVSTVELNGGGFAQAFISGYYVPVP